MIISARGAALGAMLLVSVFLAGCDDGPKQQQAAAPATIPAVTVVKVEARDLRPTVSFSARVEALQKVDLLARIQGFLEKQNFTEGASVKAGELLYVIEQAPYKAKVSAAEASVAVAAARLDRTEIELKRQTTLVSKEASAQTKLDDARTARNEAKGQYDKLIAELEQAKLQLSYTEIRAPIDGRIGKSLLSVGSFVNPQSGTLATIVQQDPIGVIFPVSQRDLLAVREKMGDSAKLNNHTVYVEIGKGKRYQYPGKVDFLDVGVNKPGTPNTAPQARQAPQTWPPKPGTPNPAPQTRHPNSGSPNPAPQSRHPKPGTPHPAHHTRHPKAGTQNPVPQTWHPKPGTAPQTRHPKPSTPNPARQTRHPEPSTPDPAPQTRHPKHGTPNPPPQTRHPKPGTPNPKTHTRHPKLGTQNLAPQTWHPNPGTPNPAA